MNREVFNFELVDTETPYVVVKNALMQIENVTNGYVKGNIEVYSGPIRSYTKQTGFAALTAMSAPQTVEVDVQDSLGEQSNVDNCYEVYLSVKGLEKYKYRLMFIDYKAIAYPVTVVLNSTLARVYSNKYEDTFLIKSMKQLEDLLDRIFNSEALIQVIQSLINEAIRRERTNAESEDGE